MDALQAYGEIVDLGLKVRLREDWNFALSPASRITPELRAALKEHKGQVTCLLAQGYVLEAAAEALGLERIGPPQAPGWSKPTTMATQAR